MRLPGLVLLLVSCSLWSPVTSGDVRAEALSQPPVCSARNVAVENTDLDADDPRALAAVWNTVGRGCLAFLDKRGQRHLFVFQDVAPSRTEGRPGDIKPSAISLRAFDPAAKSFKIYDFETEVYNNRYLPPAIELEPGDILHVREVVCLTPLPKDAADPDLPAPHQHSSLKEDGEPKDAAALCRDLGVPAFADGAPSNLHTHGLIARPRNDIRRRNTAGSPGDDPFSYIPSRKLLDYTVTVPASLPRSVLLEPTRAPEGAEIAHPTGLYWYHPHLHGLAGRQVTSGLSGVISIGDPFSLLKPPSDNDPDKEKRLKPWQLARWREEQRARTDVRYVQLRDIQLEPNPDPRNPVTPGSFRKLAKYETKLCGEWKQVRNDPLSKWALPQDATHRRIPGGCLNGDRAWLFPVNDKIHPTIEISEDRDMLLRISNQSASITYRLSILPNFKPATPSSPESAGRPLELEVIGVDGVIIGSGGGNTTAGISKSDTRQEFLMMPASRADVLIRNASPSPRRGENYELVTRRMDMSGTEDKPGSPDAAPNADVWPDIALATVHLNGPKGEISEDQRQLRPLLSERAAPAKAATATVRSALNGFERLRMAPVISNRGYPGCVDNLSVGGNERRIVVFGHRDADPKVKNDREHFLLGYRRANSRPGSERNIIEPREFPEHLDWTAAKAAPGGEETRHLCVAKGEEEVWELRNTTSEVHNFHLHQSKFRLATRDEVRRVIERGLYKKVCSDAPRDKDKPCGRDPTHYISTVHLDSPEDPGRTTDRVDTLHDTFPVPPALMDENGNAKEPGQVFIKVGFHADDQVGRFVYHCHILEHEDKGMMAPIEIIDTERKSVEAETRSKAASMGSPFSFLSRIYGAITPDASASGDSGMLPAANASMQICTAQRPVSR